MTREEAINKLNWALDNNTIEDVQSAYDYIIAIKMAIKALEQEPCEDAISRKEVLYLIADYDLSMGQVVKGIHALPSVTPQEPILDELRAEITTLQNRCYALTKGTMCAFCKYECEYKAESEG